MSTKEYRNKNNLSRYRYTKNGDEKTHKKFSKVEEDNKKTEK